MNIHGVFLHLIADALGSVVVILTGISVKFIPDSDTNWKIYIDPILSIVLSIFIMISTCPLMKESIKILMQTSRTDIDMLRKEILEVEGVADIMDLHVWSLNSAVNVGTGCLTLSRSDQRSYSQISESVKSLLRNRNIHLITIEYEIEESTNSTIDFLDK